MVSLSRGRQADLLTVDDDGPGIRADNIDRIFERFYTDRPAGEAFGQNSGLGLSISRQIVEAHGGTLTAENISGGKPGEIRGAVSPSLCPQTVSMPDNLHASAVVLGDRGIVIAGESGAGKTQLALELLSHARSFGLFARLVADDQIFPVGPPWPAGLRSASDDRGPGRGPRTWSACRRA